MIFKNDYVKIKGKKEITLKNYIYDTYLELITKSQYQENLGGFLMYYCFLKFDDDFDDIYDKEITDFDVGIELSNFGTNGSENKVEANYTYLQNLAFKTDNIAIPIDLTPYYGKKITAIGFGNYGIDYLEGILMFSCIDVSNYSIYFDEDTIFQRKDIFMSDAIATSGYPENLAPWCEKTTTVNVGGIDYQTHCSLMLYSVGFGSTKGVMEEEYVIGQDIEIIEESDTSFGFNLKRGVEPAKYPSVSTYTGSLEYPLALKVNRELYPNRNKYAGNGVHPLLSDYKYIIYKYRYFYFGESDYVYLDEYFTTNLPNNEQGLFEIVTKFERSDV